MHSGNRDDFRLRLRAETDSGSWEYWEGSDNQPLTETARDILRKHLPEAMDLFLLKNKGYGDMADVLGSRAQFVDIHRKVDKLKRALWEGEDIGNESPKEVLQDLFGHVLLMMRTLESESLEATRKALEEEKQRG